MTWDAVHDGRDTFRACLDAICAPGRVVGGLPRAGIDDDVVRDGAAAVLLALLDASVTLAHDGGPGAAVVAERVLGATGGRPAALQEADFVLATGEAVAGRASRGTALEPHAGATVLYAGAWPAVTVVLAGPGIEERRRSVALPLPEGEPGALREVNAAPPAGVDAFVLTPTGVAALPRSVTATG